METVFVILVELLIDAIAIFLCVTMCFVLFKPSIIFRFNVYSVVLVRARASVSCFAGWWTGDSTVSSATVDRGQWLAPSVCSVLDLNGGNEESGLVTVAGVAALVVTIGLFCVNWWCCSSGYVEAEGRVIPMGLCCWYRSLSATRFGKMSSSGGLLR